MRLTSLLTNSTYQSLSADEVVKAEFYIRDGGSYYTDVEIHAIQNNTTWKENDAVWSNLCVTANISFATYATSLMGGGEWECFDITSLVKAWKNGTQNAQCGFMMVLADETKYVGTLSCEYGTGENWPYFVLTYDDDAILNKTQLELFEGYSSTLTAENPDNLTLTWTSDNIDVATVSSTGTVTGVNAGTTIIRVRSADNSINASCTVHVKIRDGVYYIKNSAMGTYLENTGDDVTLNAKDTGENTKFDQLWRITYVANGRYVIRPMDDTSEALTVGPDFRIAVAEATDTSTALETDYLWAIGRDSYGIYFQHNGSSNQTIFTRIENETAIAYPGTYSSSTYCHWSLEEVKGFFLRNAISSHIITPNTAKYIELGDSLSYSELGIDYECYGSLIGGISWSSADSSIVSVGYYTGDVTGKLQGQTTIEVTANINGSTYSCCFTLIVNRARLLFETERKPGLEDDGTTAWDMYVSDLSKTDLEAINSVLASLASQYDSSFETQGGEVLKNYMRDLASIFAVGDRQMRDVTNEMIEHFLEGSGDDYSNNILTQRVYNHNSTKAFVHNTKQIIENGLKNTNYDINLLMDNYDIWSSLNDVADPTYNTAADYINGLKICLNGTWAHKIEILQYSVTESEYTCQLRYTIYDHFGLDDGDVTSSGMYSSFLGHTNQFGSWYVLQRYENCDSRYKPFVTVVSFEETISGSIE